MNDTTPSPAPAPAAPQRRATDSEPRRRSRRRALLTLLAVAVVLAVAYTILEMRRQAEEQQQLAELREREAAAATARAEAADRQAQEAAKRLAELEQAALESADSAQAAAPLSRDEAILLEVERLVTLAVHDVLLTRQKETALAALELADARLAAANAPRWQPLRRALARDLERLRALPVVDTTGIALKIDQLIAGADVWPLITTPAAPPATASAAGAPAPKGTARTAAKKAEPVAEPPKPPEPSGWERVQAWIASEFGDLVRIHEVEAPEALLLTTEQGRLVRQQLKLRLLGARLALLARNDKLYHADLESTQTLLALYFEGRQPAVANAAAMLRQINATVLAAEVPMLSESQAAVRAARARRP
jgi:uncharacterized protein HemX